MKMSNIKVELETRGCMVNDELGLFHCWEHYSKPLPESPLVGGEPAGVFSHVFGIVEFADGVRRVDPTDIRFCDEQNQFLSDMARERKDRQFYIPDDIVFRTKETAESVLATLMAYLDQYGFVTMADLYDLAGHECGEFTYSKRFWTNLDDAFVVKVVNGYSLRLPKPLEDNN